MLFGVNFERDFKAFTFNRLLLYFNNINPDDNMKFIYQDQLFGNGIMKFNLTNTYLKVMKSIITIVLFIMVNFSFSQTNTSSSLCDITNSFSNGDGGGIHIYTYNDVETLSIDFDYIDNSFQLDVASVDIHPYALQLESNHFTVGDDVQIVFQSDNNEIVSPWLPNTNGLPRVQLLIDNSGSVSLKGTRTTTSTILEALVTSDSSSFSTVIFPTGEVVITIINIDDTGADGMSGEVLVTQNCNTNVDTQAPTASTLSSTEQTNTTIGLNWTAATDNVAVTGYKIYKDGVIETTLGNVLSYQITGLTAATSYSFNVTAIDAVGNESIVSNIVIITTDAISSADSLGNWSLNNQDVYYNEGNVGIGTDEPSVDLQVEGVIAGQKGFFNNDLSVIPDGTVINHPNLLLGAGLDISNQPLFGFYDYPATETKAAYVVFEIEDRKDTRRLFMAGNEDGSTFLSLNDSSGQDRIFTVWDSGDDFADLALPKQNSHLSIGGVGLGRDGHRLHVHDGSSLFEGDILTTGKIGIGVESSEIPTDSQLAVAGKIISEEVKVQLRDAITGLWPDYVFTKNYKLPTLKEVEGYIKENGHLEDVPSAKDVKENGLLLGEMNAKLLKKIEELTLYILQQQKRINAQSESIQKIQEKLKK
ncbi:MAG: fibronectin type III domain-containing protein [Algibacter sp.]